MSLFLLTTEQKSLLRTIITFIEAGKLNEPIVPFPAGKPTTQFAIYIRGQDSFKFKRVSDLDSLCDAGLLRYRWNRLGNGKLYYVTDAGYAAVANDFHAPPEPFGQNLSLKLLTATLSNGLISLNGIEESTTLGDIVADPLLRHTAVTTLINSLQNTAEDLLAWSDFRVYYQLTQRLREALLRPQPDVLELQALFTQLSAPRASLTAWPQLWAHLYPLLLMAQLQAY